MAVGDVIETVFHSRYGDQLGLNIRHWLEATTLGSGATLSEIAVHFRGLVEPTYVSMLTANAGFVGVTAQKIFPLPKSIAVGDGGGTTAGTAVGDALARQVAGLISFRSAFAGRKERGRMYIPFASENAEDADAKPTIAYRTLLATIGTFMASNQTVGTMPNQSILAPLIWHRSSSTYSLIVAYRASQLWATQRRRGSFGPPNPEGTSGGFVIT